MTAATRIGTNSEQIRALPLQPPEGQGEGIAAEFSSLLEDFAARRPRPATSATASLLAEAAFIIEGRQQIELSRAADRTAEQTAHAETERPEVEEQTASSVEQEPEESGREDVVSDEVVVDGEGAEMTQPSREEIERAVVRMSDQTATPRQDLTTLREDGELDDASVPESSEQSEQLLTPERQQTQGQPTGTAQRTPPEIRTDARSTVVEKHSIAAPLDESASPVVPQVAQSTESVGTPTTDRLPENVARAQEFRAILSQIHQTLGLSSGGAAASPTTPSTSKSTEALELASRALVKSSGVGEVSQPRTGDSNTMGAALTGRSERRERSENASRGAAVARTVITKMIERVESALKEVAQSKDGKSLTLRLEPNQLGTVRVDVSIRDGALHARIGADSATTIAVLRERAADLHESLRKLGIDVQQVTVSVVGDSTTGAHEERQGQPRGQGAGSEKMGQELSNEPVSVPVEVIDVQAQVDGRWVA